MIADDDDKNDGAFKIDHGTTDLGPVFQLPTAQ